MSAADPIDAAWLEARGFLHDARVTAAALIDGTIHLGLDDEWASDPRKGTAPGSLIIEGVGVWAGEVATWLGGRVSGIEFEGERLAVRFSDRDSVVVDPDRVLWAPS